MNNRDRILALLNGKKADRVPWFADLDYWYGAELKKGLLSEEYRNDGYFQLNKDTGTGFYLQGFHPFAQINCDVSFKDEIKGNERKRTMSTPYGELYEIQQFLTTSYSWGYVKHFVETLDDLRAFRCYIEDIRYEKKYEEAIRRYGIIKDNGVVLCYTPRSPFMELITTYIGIENLSYLLMDAPDEMEEILLLMEEKHDEAARLTLLSPAECIMIPENLSSEVVGKNYYKEFMQPYEKKWIERIRQAGKYSFIHMDGTLRGLINEVIETGFDVIEAVTPEPSGDMSMDEVAAIDAKRSIIWGGLPGIIFTPAVSEEDFKKHVIYILNIMKKEPRFVLGVADQVPPDGLIERVAMVRGLCDKYGIYD